MIEKLAREHNRHTLQKNVVQEYSDDDRIYQLQDHWPNYFRFTRGTYSKISNAAIYTNFEFPDNKGYLLNQINHIRKERDDPIKRFKLVMIYLVKGGVNIWEQAKAMMNQY